MAPPKAKAQKAQKMSVGDFLTDTSLGSWADEMEDAPIPCSRSSYGGDRAMGSGGGGYSSGGVSERGGYSIREELPLPTKPPYTVHLGNMSFDATEGDIQDFFSTCSVTSVRIVEDKMDGKPKGFAYVEFATLDGLKKALEFNGVQFQGRNIRVSVAGPQKDRAGGRDISDWSRKGPLPDISGPRRGSDRSNYGGDRVIERSGFGSGRNFENGSDAGSERGNRRPMFEQSDGKVRDFSNWERKGPLPAPASNAPPGRTMDRPVSKDGPSDRRNSPAWGEGRSQDGGSRPPRREFVERPVAERAPTAAEADNQWRAKMRPDPQPAAPVTASPTPSSRELSVPSSPVVPPTPTTRPKLNLQKRTVSDAENSPVPVSASADPKASPFGAAKPIDTFAREKEVEEKRELVLRQKKEVEEKAREEKRLAEEKAKDERKLTREAGKNEKLPSPKEKPVAKPNGQVKEKENGVETPVPGKNFEILRRTPVEDTKVAEEEGGVEGVKDVDAKGENGLVRADNEIKPQEVVRDIPSTKTNGVDSQQHDASPEPTADALEGDGWSTVPAAKRSNNKRNPNAATRAIAS